MASAIASDERDRIDEWIRREGRNKWGDDADTMYAGGNPLFNELTGELTDKYEYILRKHPSRPWNSSGGTNTTTAASRSHH